MSVLAHGESRVTRFSTSERPYWALDSLITSLRGVGVLWLRLTTTVRRKPKIKFNSAI